MDLNKDPFETLLRHYCVEDLTDTERVESEERLRAHPDYVKEGPDYERLMHHIHTMPIPEPPSSMINTINHRVHQRLEHNILFPKPRTRNKPLIYTLALAASLCGIIVLGIVMQEQPIAPPTIKMQTATAPRQDARKIDDNDMDDIEIDLRILAEFGIFFIDEEEFLEALVEWDRMDLQDIEASYTSIPCLNPSAVC